MRKALVYECETQRESKLREEPEDCAGVRSWSKKWVKGQRGTAQRERITTAQTRQNLVEAVPAHKIFDHNAALCCAMLGRHLAHQETLKPTDKQPAMRRRKKTRLEGRERTSTRTPKTRAQRGIGG